MTLNTILNACDKCDAEYKRLCTQEPRLTEDEIMDGINKYNREHECIFHHNDGCDLKIFYDIHLKTGQTIYGMEHDICNQNGETQSTELIFTRFDKETQVRYNFTCNAEDIVALGEQCMQVPMVKEE